MVLAVVLSAPHTWWWYPSNAKVEVRRLTPGACCTHLSQEGFWWQNCYEASLNYLRLLKHKSMCTLCRKAYRLGKFLQDVNDIRKIPSTTRTAMLETIAAGGEGVYYFVEQFTWCEPSLCSKFYSGYFPL
jgi:hypothetical protein